MTFDRHHRLHWIGVAAVTAAALFTLSEAWGQSTGAAAVFEGRPAMAGAQAGQGAMAGPPQGGVGVQGSDGIPGRAVGGPRELGGVRPIAPEIPRDPGVAPLRSPSDVQPVRDHDPGGLAKDSRTASKVKRVAKRTVRRARDIDPLR